MMGLLLEQRVSSEDLYRILKTFRDALITDKIVRDGDKVDFCIECFITGFENGKITFMELEE